MSDRLTPRERECLQLVAQHFTSKGIARQLGLSQHTVDGHLQEARRKLGAPTRRDAVRMFLESEREAPPSNSGGQTEGAEVLAIPVPEQLVNESSVPPKIENPRGGGGETLIPPSSEWGQSTAVVGVPEASSREPSTGGSENRDDFKDLDAEDLDQPRAAAPALFRARSGAARYELSPPQRLAAIVVIAAVSALVLMLLLVGAHELTFLIQRMTEGG